MAARSMHAARPGPRGSGTRTQPTPSREVDQELRGKAARDQPQVSLRASDCGGGPGQFPAGRGGGSVDVRRLGRGLSE